MAQITTAKLAGPMVMVPLSLVTLPDEIQQMIYRHVYPVTDITLLPDSDPNFKPKDLTSEFNLIGNHGYALLQTCSKVCAVAKPVRDSSFTGRVNVSRVKDLIHCGFWIAQNVETICLVPTDIDPVSRPHLTLFPQLRKVVIVDTKVTPDSIGSTNSLVGSCSENSIYIEMAKALRFKHFSPVISLDSADQRPYTRRVLTLDHASLISELDIYVYLRFVMNDDRHGQRTLGVIVHLLGPAQTVITRAVQSPQSLAYWELKPVTDEDKSDVKNHGLGSLSADDVHSRLDPGGVLSGLKVTTVPLDKIPERLKWVKHDDTKVEFDDLILM